MMVLIVLLVSLEFDPLRMKQILFMLGQTHLSFVCVSVRVGEEEGGEAAGAGGQRKGGAQAGEGRGEGEEEDGVQGSGGGCCFTGTAEEEERGEEEKER